MSCAEAAALFMALLAKNGAGLSPRDPSWLDYSEPKNVFTRSLEA